MMIGVEDERPARLVYPFEAPEPGGARAIAEGVLWLRAPLPFSLDHINLYALVDGDGWTLVDTGLGDRATGALWDRLAVEALEGRPIRRVICTHMHPDHIGQAGALCRRFDAPLWMSRLEYVVARMLIADTGRQAPEEGVSFYRRAGWSEAQLEGYRARFGMFGRGVTAMPDSYRRIEEGETMAIGARVWRVIMGCGHSPEHVCLWSEADKLMIAGDQVLPKISSNISVWPTEPAADPLADWLASCRKLKDALPADLLVLPSHGEPFTGLHVRLDALMRGHERRLARLHKALEGDKRVVDLFSAMFLRPVPDGELGMATGETLAHLNHLIARGQAMASLGSDGVARYARCACV